MALMTGANDVKTLKQGAFKELLLLLKSLATEQSNQSVTQPPRPSPARLSFPTFPDLGPFIPLSPQPGLQPPRPSKQQCTSWSPACNGCLPNKRRPRQGGAAQGGRGGGGRPRRNLSVSAVLPRVLHEKVTCAFMYFGIRHWPRAISGRRDLLVFAAGTGIGK